MVFHYLKSGYAKIKSALSKARSYFGEKISSLFRGKIDEATLDRLEQLLYEADFGVQTAMELTSSIRAFHKTNPNATHDDFMHVIKSELLTLLKRFPPVLSEESPSIILIVGVNGNGKTTSTAKLAHLFKENGKKVLVGAADTFRAAAIEQLETWTKRLSIDIVKGAPKSDPAAVTFDTVQAGLARGADVILIDTAGRLHTKTALMQELDKIRRSCKKLSANAPHETLLVLDATTGQNAIDQARIFHQYTPLTGIILTKLDGTAKGGIVVAIQRELGIPVKFIGTGEQVDDFELFNADSFVSNLFE